MHLSDHSSVATIIGLCQITRARTGQATQYSENSSVGESKPARVSVAGTVR